MLKLEAFAKINLFLEVPGVRPDGYHELWTLFQSIGLSDTLSFEPTSGEILLACSDSQLPVDTGNLVYRAAVLLKETFKVSRGASIHLEKRIPIGAGLGGGSTDAATVLRGLNELWELKASPEELESLGTQLGMDVPFCVRGGTVYAEGRGEILRENLPIPSGWIVLVYPNLFVSTQKVYQEIDRLPIGPLQKVDKMKAALQIGNLQDISSSLFNRLETASFSLYPQLESIKSQIQSLGCLGSLMSGSGSSIFGICESVTQAESFAMQLSQKTGYWCQAMPFID